MITARDLVGPHRRPVREDRALLIATLSAAGRPDLFSWYVSAGALVALVIIATLPETRGRVLT